MRKPIPAQKAWDRVSALDQEIGECIDGIGRFRLRGGTKSQSFLELREAGDHLKEALWRLQRIAERSVDGKREARARES
jgi:hypothetical protein